MPKVSVIVPVYKVEKHLERCVASIRNQTLEDIEIILVDDGSPDACPFICDEFAKLDDRIKVVHKENGGLSSARNSGIMIATGEYLAYADSDDYVELDAYEKLYNCAKKENVDFIVADYWRVDNKRHQMNLNIRGGLYKKDDIKKEIFPILIMRECVDYGPLLSVWHGLYKTSFIRENNLYFDEDIKWSEDCIYSAILGYKANSFYYLKNEYVYDYVQNEGSISKSYRNGEWEVYCLMNEKLRGFFCKVDDYDFSRQLDLHILYFACATMGDLRYVDSRQERKRIRKEILDDRHLRTAMKNFEIPEVILGMRILIFLLKWNKPLLLNLFLETR